MLGVPLADSILECHPEPPDTSIRHPISGVEHETEAELTRNFPTNPDITGHFVQPAAHLIVEFRSRRRWSQERLAEKSGLSSRTIQRIERGESTHRTTIARLASALGVALDDCITTAAGLPSKDHIVSQLVNVRCEIPPCPYRGLLAFGEDDAEVFFGREVLVQRLKEKLLQSNLVQVSGCSGSGKSSLVAAGLVPALKRDDSWQVLYCRPGGDPFGSLAAVLVVTIGGGRAFYSPATDHISLPPESAFRGPPEWAATALHELAHWTGHASRLNRDMKQRFGSAGYAMEELRAELASAFVANELGIPSDIPQHASYIADWIKPLKDDKREIFRAAADAQRIVDMELGFHPAYAAQMAAPSTPAPIRPARDRLQNESLKRQGWTPQNLRRNR